MARSLVDPFETPDEKHERVTRILEKNSMYSICIACEQPITKQDNLLSTKHGNYHDLPKTCAEDGKPEERERYP